MSSNAQTQQQASANGYSYWRPDTTVLDCELCLMTFSLFNRRHHCRDCGGIFCAKCTETKTAMPHRNHEKPQRICVLCNKYVVNKLLKKGVLDQDIQRMQAVAHEEAPMFAPGGGASGPMGGFLNPGAQQFSSAVDDEHAKDEYERIAKRFRDAMIKRTETEKDLSNYSFIGGAASSPSLAGGSVLLGSSPAPKAALSGLEMLTTSNASFISQMSCSQARQQCGGNLLDCPKKAKYLAKMTKAPISFARQGKAGGAAAAPSGPLLVPAGSMPVQGDVIGLLNLKTIANANNALPPPTPSAGPNGTFSQTPKGERLTQPFNHGTKNNVHPAFLRVREALGNAHKITLDSGAAQLMGHENTPGSSSSPVHHTTTSSSAYHPRPSTISVF